MLRALQAVFRERKILIVIAVTPLTREFGGLNFLLCDKNNSQFKYNIAPAASGEADHHPTLLFHVIFLHERTFVFICCAIGMTSIAY